MGTDIRTGRDALQRVCHFACGPDADFRTSTQFTELLVACAKKISKQKPGTPTETAIRKWDNPNNDGPKLRLKSAEFLIDFLDWLVEEKNSLKEKGEQYDDLANDLTEWVRVLRVTRNEPASTTSIESKHPGEKPAPPNSLLSLAGTYQILRPYTSNAESFVLEGMSINPETDDRERMLSMYSHNHPKRRLLYRGSVTVNNKYCFGSCVRTHEDHDELKTSRAIVLQVASKDPCLSGLLLRGVRGQKSSSVAVAIPFIAIKTTRQADSLDSSEPTQIRPDLYSIPENVLLGHVSKTEVGLKSIFEFCSGIFEKLRPFFSNENGFSIQTVPSQELWKALGVNDKTNDAYLHAWKNAISEILQKRD